MGLNFALAAGLLCWDAAGRLRRLPIALALLCVAGAGSLQIWRMPAHLSLLRATAACQKRAHREARRSTGCLKAFYYRSSSPAMALRVGDIHAGGSFSEPIRRLYPDALFLNDILGGSRYPRLLKSSTLAAEPLCFVFQGSPGGPTHPFSDISALDRRALPVQGRLEVLFNCGPEAVFRIDKRTLTGPAPAP